MVFSATGFIHNMLNQSISIFLQFTTMPNVLGPESGPTNPYSSQYNTTTTTNNNNNNNID